MEYEILQGYTEFFKALGNKHRIKIILCLKDSPKNVTGIVECLGAEQSTISHNLQILLEFSIIKVEQKGKERVYSLNEKIVNPLFKLIDDHLEKSVV